MKKRFRVSKSNIILLLVLLLLLLPWTRKPIQVALHKVIGAISTPSAFAKAEQQALTAFSYPLTTLDGQSRSVAVGQGKPVLINYWATWCPPCIAEMPDMQALYERYGDRIDFLFLTDEEPQVVTRFLNRKGYELPVYNPQIQAPEALQTRSIPRTFLIDQTGRIVLDESGAANWDSEAMNAILDEVLSQ
ncbi:TlpA family protein disulfide reductase [Croceiramulus getboli]|nr:TlpA disulfide reductase family protein [Flavobacteriaceae bacterium YJPT1-3]